MRISYFFRLGEYVYKFRVGIILLWMLLILGCFPFLPKLTTPFQSTGFVAKNSESELTDRYLDKKIGYNANRFIILYHSKTLSANQTTYINKIKQSLTELKNFPLAHEIIYPDTNIQQISKDKHTAYVAILFKSKTPMDPQLLTQFKNAIKTPTNMTLQVGGEGIFIENVNKQTEKDLYKADFIATPISIVTLVVVFGTVVAAIVPICLGGGCALIILTTLYWLGHFFSLSIYTLNIALLLGLCLSLDYALFIIYRFRDELRSKKPIANVIAMTLATAGKAVFFSGLAVFISLSALLLFPINILFSVGVGGLAAVFIAVAIAVTLLPAILAVIKNGINRWAVFNNKYTFLVTSKLQTSSPSKTPSLTEKKVKTWQVWHVIAITVVKRPIAFFFGTLAILLMLGYPFINTRLGISDFHMLPKHSEGRQFFNSYGEHFNLNELSPILIVATTSERILSQENLKKLTHFVKKLKRNPLIAEVNSIVSSNPQLSQSQYYALYHVQHSLMPESVLKLLKTTTSKHATVISVVSKYDVDSPQTKQLIATLRGMNAGSGITLHLTGTPVSNVEVFENIEKIFPYAITWIITLTYCILLVLLRSVFLPLKAILMNVLSLCASYGVLVFIFQEGHLHQLLNFNPQGMLDISMLIIIFCALFGFSMDYEVFLLTRIQECYKTTQHNRKSVIFGIVKSSRIITSAAIIVICLCGSFMVANDIMVKEFGLGIAVAIFVDAFIIRTLLVPATMVLLNKWNWYLPQWLSKILPDSTTR